MPLLIVILEDISKYSIGTIARNDTTAIIIYTTLIFHSDAITPKNNGVKIFIIPLTNEFMEKILSYSPIFWKGTVMIA